ncbi:DUF5994 family protein [Streptomyces pathocidini]|uniref:DUF5994 family protein n=1 Tax=Streptomyces pathocidini TaxID=1650571 RepID=A0ABW7URC9_9ACTN|nr:DUF5994 family protein [Streptomyces pathocidini]
MTSTTDNTPPLNAPVPSPPARLSLTPADSGPGLLDGAWWPYSRDLARELPALIDVLDCRWGRITRVAVNPTFSPVIPREVPVGGHLVHVGWFAAEQDPHKLLLSCRAGRWDLLMIPPEREDTSAARLMAAEEAIRAGQTERGEESVWESESGTAPSPPGSPATPYGPVAGRREL